MKIFFYRITGSALIAGAFIGFLLAVAGLIYLWSSKEQNYQNINANITLLSRAVRTTSDNLQVVDQTLSNARENLKMVKSSTVSLAKTIGDTKPSFKTLSTEVGTNLPNMVSNTRSSLSSAASSAKLVDDTLRVVSAIPFVGTRYKPDIPLETALQNVSDSLKQLPDFLLQMQTGIDSTAKNLDEFKIEMDSLSLDLDKIDARLVDSQGVVHQYQDLTTELSGRIDQWQKDFSRVFNGIYWVLTLFLVWVLLVQFSLFTQGLELLSKT